MALAQKHLPYESDPSASRFAFYENHWKHTGCALLRRHLEPAGQTVLDYGCGRGESLQIFGQAGYSVTGTDADPECVQLAARFGPATQLDISDPVAQFGTDSFDAVVCFHVLEHVDNPKAVLNALRAIARKYVVLAVPNLRKLVYPFTRTISIDGFNEGHLQSWDHWHLLNLAERHCGLKLVEWGFDATMLPGFHRFSERFLGRRATIWLETGLFVRLFPFHGVSVLGLFRRA